MAHARPSRPRRRLHLAVALALGAAVLGACSADGGSDVAGGVTTSTGAESGSTATVAESTTTTTTEATTTTTSTPGRRPPLSIPPVTPRPPGSGPTTAPPVAPADPLDWDGATWDLGNVVSVRTDDAGVVIGFDRYQFYEEDGGLREGPSLTGPPIVYANSDLPYLNENPAIREVRLAPDVDIEVLTNVDEVCRSRFEDDMETEAVYEYIEPGFFLSWAGDDADFQPPGFTSDGQDVLTYGDDGLVVQLLFLSSC